MVNRLLELAKTKLGCGYVWGSDGEHEVLTQEDLNNYIKTHGRNHYVFNDSQGVVDASKWIGKQCFDFSGLIVYCLRKLGYINQNQDYNAEMFLSQLCTTVAYKDLKEGDLVFIKNEKNEINHIGIYAGDGKVVEAIGTRWGVCYGHIERFNLFGRLKFEGLNVTFVDIAGHWAEKAIEKLAHDGIVSGYPDGTFRPDEKMTRAEVCALISKLR